MAKKLSKQFTTDVAGALVDIARERIGVTLDDDQAANAATSLAKAGRLGENFHKSLDALTEQEYHRLIARFDIRYFRDRYFKDIFYRPSAKCHDEWIDLWEDVEAGVIHCPVIIVGQREFGKTTHFCFLFPIHSGIFGIFRYIPIIGASVDVASVRTRAIKYQLENNEKLIREIGNLVPLGRDAEWTGSAFTMSNGVRFQAAGPQAKKSRGALSITFKRPELAIVDDLEDKQQISSPTTRQRLYSFVTETLEPSLDRDRGILLYNGTLMHHDSALARLADHYSVVDEVSGEPRGIVRKYKARKENGESEWPELLSEEDLDKMRREKPRVYWTEYMGAVADPEEVGFQEIHHYEWKDIDGKELVYFGAADLQKKKTEKHDFFAVVTLGWCEADGCAYCMPYVHCRPGFKEKKQFVRDEWVRYEWYTLGLEEPGGGEMFRDALEEDYPELPGLINCSYIIYQSGRGIKEERIENNLESPVRTGMIRFLKNQGEIVEELQWLGHAKMDLADALEMCWCVLQEWRKAKKRRRRIRAFSVSVKQGIQGIARQRDTAND